MYIPKKYLDRYGHLLDGSAPYTVIIKRRNEGYDVRITVEVQTEVKEGGESDGFRHKRRSHRFRCVGKR